jgi:hypothetical protein
LRIGIAEVVAQIPLNIFSDYFSTIAPPAIDFP